ncbi:MAG: LUD domain-containing protein [Bacteroidales bacterium]|nr:LUD domain-containing protein [Bacteroidales bacterium]MDE7073146.1 LUD domain-containing protein [Bacteroidales bacterium]
MDFYRQVFLRKVSENMRKKDESPLFEAVSEYYEKNTSDAQNYFSRYEAIKERITFYKNKVMSDLPNYLIDFELRISSAGAKVIYAEDAAHAAEEVKSIIGDSSKVFISRSDILDELNLYRALKGKGVKLSRIGVGEFPYSILSETTQKLLRRLSGELNMEEMPNDTETVISVYKRKLLNEMFSDSIAITGADFLVSDSGSVVMVENDGVRNMLSSFCRKQIVLAGIDSLIPSFNELEYFTSMLSAHAYGCPHAWNQLIINGPRKTGEIDGPEELYVVLVDNGRTGILKKAFQRSVLNCIHCQACTALCPVFKYVNAFDGTPLVGPLNCITDPIKNGFQESGFLSFACTLCGKCSQICPSGINFQELILYNRKESVENDAVFSIRRKQMKILKRMLLKQKSLHSAYNRFVLKFDFKKDFGQQKEFPDFSQKSFRMLWLERHKETEG